MNGTEDKATVMVEAYGYKATLESNPIRCGSMDDLREVFCRLALAAGFHQITVSEYLKAEEFDG